MERRTVTRDEKKCGHPKADSGDPCQSFASCDECGKCWAHCEHNEEERAAARRKGGHMTAKKRNEGEGLSADELPPLTDHEAAEVWTDAIGRAAATGRLPANAAQASLRAVREWRESHESGEVSDRLNALTDALDEWRRTGDPEPVLELVDGGES